MDRIPEVLIQRAKELELYYGRVYPKLAPMVKQCFLSTIETTVKKLEDGSYFVITGDIPAMWLRDSGAQVRHYVKYAKQDPELDEILQGVIRRQFQMVLLDPYANAFNEMENGLGHQDETQLHPGVWERKYEVDSLCMPLYLAYQYWIETGNEEIFDDVYLKVVTAILEVFEVEQDHSGRSPYHFRRFDCPETDTLPREGKGNPVVPCGMTWSGFRPSDDRCKYGYLVPANMMAVKALEYAAEVLEQVYGRGQWNDGADEGCAQYLAGRCRELAGEIRRGIDAFGVIDYPGLGKIYAYEVDGQGNHVLMDDANSPSLLAIPYLGYADKEDERYVRTRKFVLSQSNPYFYQGEYADGVGSPHTPEGYVWGIGIIMRALTSSEPEEIKHCLDMLAQTHAGTYYMHESFDPDQPECYTREWFAWANSLFGELLDRLMDSKLLE